VSPTCTRAGQRGRVSLNHSPSQLLHRSSVQCRLQRGGVYNHSGVCVSEGKLCKDGFWVLASMAHGMDMEHWAWHMAYGMVIASIASWGRCFTRQKRKSGPFGRPQEEWMSGVSLRRNGFFGCRLLPSVRPWNQPNVCVL